MPVEKVEVYKTGDGSFHASLEAAVAHQICQLLEGLSDQGFMNARTFASDLVKDAGLRETLIGHLEQLNENR